MSSNKDRLRTTELAEKYVKRGKLQEAIAEYKKLLTGGAQEINVRNIISDLYLKSNQKGKALAEFYIIASYYEERGLYSQAMAIYKKINKLDPRNNDAAMKLGDLYARQGFLSEAKAEYLKIGKDLVRNNRVKRAIFLYEKLKKLDRKDVQIKLALADLYIRAESNDQAVEELNEVAEIKIRSNAIKEAEEILERAKKLKGDHSRTLTNLIDLLKKKDEKKEALNLVSDILRKDKDNVKALRHMGNLYFDDQDFNKAEEIFSKIISLRPNDIEARVKLGQINILQDNLDQAFEIYEPLVDTLIKKQKVEKAIGLLGLILSSKKAHIPTLEGLASIYKSNNQEKNLEIVYRVILEEYHEKNLREESLSVLSELVRLCPEDEEINNEYNILIEKREPFGEEKETKEAELPISEERGAEEPVVEPKEAEASLEEAGEMRVPLSEEKEVEAPLEETKEAGLPVSEEKEAEEPAREPKEAEVSLEEAGVVEEPLKEEKEVELPLEETREAGLPISEEKEAEEPAREPKEAEVSLEEAGVVEEPLKEEKEAEVPLEEAKEVEIPAEEEKTAEEPLGGTERVERIFEKTKEKETGVPIEEKKEADVRLDLLEGTEQRLEMSLAQADLYIEQGLLRNARRILENLRISFPDDPQINQRLASLDKVSTQAKVDEILQRVERVSAEETKLFGKKAYFRFNLGIAFLEQGLIDEAIEEFKLASKDKSRTVECYSVISNCYRQKKDFQEAAKWLEKALKITKAGTDWFFALKYELASIYEDLKKTEKALEVYLEIKKLDSEYKDVNRKIEIFEKRLKK